ncbi:hypothetical protein B0H10DRAFT_1804707, partial [Mycena sp. CBHHK59/15]
RFIQWGKAEDSDEAVQLNHEALVLCPSGHLDHKTPLNNLGHALSIQFLHKRDPADIDKAIQLYWECLGIQPTGHHDPDHGLSLNNLGLAIQDRFMPAGNIGGIDEAIQLLRDALLCFPSPHSDRGNSLRSLGVCLLSRYTQTWESVSLNDALSALPEALVYPSSSPLSRFESAKYYAQKAIQHKHFSALSAYQIAIGLLPQLAALDFDLQSRQQILITAQSSGLGCDAATCAVGVGQYVVAVELLEAGRSIFWSQALHLCTSLHNLSIIKPHLASKISVLSWELEMGSFRDASRNVSIDTHQKAMSIEAEGIRFHTLNDELEETMKSVRKLPGFDDFMRTKSMVALQRAAAHGPVVILNAGESACHALILNVSGEVQCVPFTEGMTRLVITLLAKCKTPSPAWLWWCPTGLFAFLPIHAAGIYGRDTTESVADYFISSYMPPLTALLTAPFTPPTVTNPLRVTAVIQPEGSSPLPYTVRELKKIEEHIPNEWLTALGTPESPASVDKVLSHLRTSSIVHFACHGIQDVSNLWPS